MINQRHTKVTRFRFACVAMLSVIVLGILSLPIAAQSQDILKAAMATNPPTLDPHISTTAACRQLAFYIGESLAAMDEDYNLNPWRYEGATC